MNELPVFRYFVCLATEPYQQTTFQIFDAAWLAALDYVAQIAQCPCTTVDLDGTCRERAELRVTGRARHWIAVVPTTTVQQVDPPRPFMVLFTAARTDDWGRKYVAQHPEPVLHVPEEGLTGESTRQDLSRDVFAEFAARVLGHMSKYSSAPLPTVGPERIDSSTDHLPPLRVTSYIRTAPNHAALISVGYPQIELVPAGPEDKTDEAARRAFEDVVSFRQAILPRDVYPPGATNLLISSAGLSRRLRHIKRQTDSFEFNQGARAFNEVQRFRALDLIPAKLWASFKESPAATEVLEEREFEIRGQVVATVVEAASQLLPTVLLQEGLGKPIRDRKSIADTLRHRGNKWKASDLDVIRRLGRELASSLPPYAMAHVQSEFGTVKALMDEPIEMMAVDGRPLSLQRPVVRVPVTPGLLLTRQVGVAAPLVLERTDFRQVLILRGTTPDDPVYPWLEVFSQEMAKQATNVVVNTIDVRTESDVRSALEQFEGAMLAFDAHGIHLAGQLGIIQIGEATVTMHDIRSPFPPIVFLASCETHAIGRGEETVSAALLNAGVRCVIGTMTSISAAAAGLLFSDLIARATQSQPAYGGLWRWSELFAASLWACHAIEAATVLANAKVIGLSPPEIGQFVDRLEHRLIRFDRNWFEAACEELSNMSGVETRTIRDEWLRRAYVTDCAMFCQLGQPDTILLSPLTDPRPSIQRH